MIIWSGLGFFVAVIPFISCLLAEVLLDAQFGQGFYSSHLWAVGDAVFVGGIISSKVGFILKQRSGRLVADKKTGEPMRVNRTSHTFFFVPMHWAGLVVAVIGLAVVISDALN